MPDKKLTQLDNATSFNDDDKMYVVQGGIGKQISKQIATADLVKKTQNLSDLSNPAVALSNIGGLTSSAISALMDSKLSTYYTDEKIHRLVAKEFEPTLSNSGGIIVSGCNRTVPTAGLGSCSIGLVVLQTQTGPSLFMVPENNTLPVTSPEYVVVEDVAYNTNPANTGEFKRGRIIAVSALTGQSYVSLDSEGTVGNRNRHIDNIYDHTISKLKPFKVMITSASLGSQFSLSNTNPAGALIYPNGEIALFGEISMLNTITVSPNSTALIEIINLSNLNIPNPDTNIYGINGLTTHFYNSKSYTTSSPAQDFDLFAFNIIVRSGRVYWRINGRHGGIDPLSIGLSHIRYQS